MRSFILEYFGETASQIAEYYWPFILPLPMFLFLRRSQIVYGMLYYLAGLGIWLVFFKYVGIYILTPIFSFFVFGVLVLVPWIWAVGVFRYLRKKAHGNDQALTSAGGR